MIPISGRSMTKIGIMSPELHELQLEQEIDRLVYELYDLTEEEIAIVEGTAK